MSYIAFQYAEALFSLALEHKSVDDVSAQYRSFLDGLDEEIMHFFYHPKITKNEKKEVLDQLKLDNLFTHFLYVLIDNSRFELVHDVQKEFQRIIDNQHKLMNVTVYSKKKLTKAQLDKLTTELQHKHNRDVVLDNIVDATIIGGLRLEFDGQVFDSTVNSQLHHMQSSLKQR